MFDPDIVATPGQFVIALHGATTVAGTLKLESVGDEVLQVIVPLNPVWPQHRPSPDRPIAIMGVKTEVHLKG